MGCTLSIGGITVFSPIECSFQYIETCVMFPFPLFLPLKLLSEANRCYCKAKQKKKVIQNY